MNYQKTCKFCAESFSTNLSAKVYCTEFCRTRSKCKESSIREKYTSSNGYKLGKVGDISELEVSAHYLREGWEVFRNVSQNGPADLCIWNPVTQEIRLIDVKSMGKDITESIHRANIAKSHKQVEVTMYQYVNGDLKEQSCLDT